MNLSLFLHKIFFKLVPVWSTILNSNFCNAFLIFGPIFGIQWKVIVCFLSVLLLLLLLILRAFFSKLLIIFCNYFRSCPFSQYIPVRYSISTLKYFSEKVLVALARNPLNMLVMVPEGTQECGLICTFVTAGLRWTTNLYLPLLLFNFISRKFKHVLHFHFLL